MQYFWNTKTLSYLQSHDAAIQSRIWTLEEHHVQKWCCAVHPLRRHKTQTHFTILDVNLDHLFRLVSDKFTGAEAYQKLTSLWWKMGYWLTLKLPPTSLSIQWRPQLDSLIAMVVKWGSTFPVIPSAFISCRSVVKESTSFSLVCLYQCVHLHSYSMGCNPLRSFVLILRPSQSGLPLQAGSCVVWASSHLLALHSPGSFCALLTQPWNHLFPQGALVSFSQRLKTFLERTE